MDDNDQLEGGDEQSELEALVRALKFARGFKLLMVICDPSRMKAQQERAQAAWGQRAEVVELDGPVTDLLDALLRHLGERAAAALFVSGLERSVTEVFAEGRSVPLISAMNARRDSFAKILHCPLVLWVPRYVYAAIAQGAPDFISIRSGLFVLAAPSAQALNLKEPPPYDQPWTADLPRQEKYALLTQIQTLLAEQEALSADRRNNEAIGNLLFRQAQLQASLTQWREALQTLQRLAMPQLNLAKMQSVMKLMARIFSEISNVDGEIRMVEGWLSIARVQGKTPDQIEALVTLGDLAAKRNEIQKRDAYYKEALALGRAAGQTLPGSTQLDLATVIAVMGDVQQALQICVKVRQQAQQSADRRLEGSAQARIGFLFLALSQIKEAIGAYEEALGIFEQLGDRFNVCQVQLALGQAYFSVGAFEPAFDCLGDCAKAAMSLGAYKHAAEALRLSTIIMASVGQPKRAIELRDSVIQLAQTTLNPTFTAQVHSAFGIAYAVAFYQEQGSEAAHFAQMAEQEFSTAAALDPASQETFYNWGSHLFAMATKDPGNQTGSLLAAAEKYQISDRLKPGSSALELARVYARLGQEQQCQSWLTQAMRHNQSQTAAAISKHEEFAAYQERQWLKRMLSDNQPLSA